MRRRQPSDPIRMVLFLESGSWGPRATFTQGEQAPFLLPVTVG